MAAVYRVMIVTFGCDLALPAVASTGTFVPSERRRVQ